MKRYLVTEEDLDLSNRLRNLCHYPYSNAQQIPADARVLTREQIERAIMKADSKFLADPSTVINRALDELFGKSE